ncbi:GGDEF domain-containing protein [Agromyces silvae]|uniref:GGDEF domain-containing protein n=1 Tax=Agromyces silvae TaxID=3388266 RepID=UPI00280A6F77|nr:GGDEF domain-containing protein [Agromyces protaetiae]
MNIDLYSIQLATSAVIIVAGVMFILDTFLRRPDTAGRVWSASFMAGILASFSYAIWIAIPDGWWAVAAGNSALVLSVALLWTGARVYNGRRDRAWISIVGSGAAAVAVLAEGPNGGAWAGGPLMFALVAGFAVMGAIESMRAPMRLNWTARGLTAMFVVVALFYAARFGVFVVSGPDSMVFQVFLGTEASAFVIIALVIVTVVSMVILQSERVPRVGERPAATGAYTADGVLAEPAFRAVVGDWLERANFHDEQLVVASVCLDERESIDTAFGRSTGTELIAQFTAGVRRYSTPNAAIGAVGPGELLVVAPYSRMEEARRNGLAIQSGLRDRPIEQAMGLRISASIGLAGTDAHGYGYDALVAAAFDAAATARERGGDAVVLAD